MTTIQNFIDFFSAIPEEKWCENSMISSTGQRCLMGHLYSKDWKGDVFQSPTELTTLSNILAANNSCLASAVAANNGNLSSPYKQKTPKQRVLAFLNDIKDREDTQPAVEEVQQIVNNPKIEEYEPA